MKSTAHGVAGLAPEVWDILTKAAAGEKVTADGVWFGGDKAESTIAGTYVMADLVNMHQLLRKTCEKYDSGGLDSRVLQQLLYAVNNSVKRLEDTLMEQEASRPLQAFRDGYEHDARSVAHALNDPAVQAAQKGRLGDVDKAVVDSRSGPDSIRALRLVMGDLWWQQYHHYSVARLRKKLTRWNGVIRKSEVLDKLSAMSPNTPNAISGQEGKAFTGSLTPHTTKQSDKLSFKDTLHIAVALLIFFGVPALLVWALTPDSIRYPVLYGVIYRVGVTHVEVQKKPTDCEWEHSPLGDKGCHYAKQVAKATNDAGRVTDVFVTWDKLQD